MDFALHTMLKYTKNLLNLYQLNKKKFIKDFIKEIQSSKDYNILMSHENLKFNLFFEKIFYSILSVLDFYLDEYKNAKKILKKINPKTVIFQSM